MCWLLNSLDGKLWNLWGVGVSFHEDWFLESLRGSPLLAAAATTVITILPSQSWQTENFQNHEFLLRDVCHSDTRVAAARSWVCGSFLRRARERQKKGDQKWEPRGSWAPMNTDLLFPRLKNYFSFSVLLWRSHKEYKRRLVFIECINVCTHHFYTYYFIWTSNNVVKLGCFSLFSGWVTDSSVRLKGMPRTHGRCDDLNRKCPLSTDSLFELLVPAGGIV